MNLTPHFTLEEMIRSEYAIRHGLDNTPSDEVLTNLRVLCEGLERVRDVLGVPVHVLSGYRSLVINASVKGAKDSQHMKGQAADIEAPAYGSPLEIARAIFLNRDKIPFDQLINESGWVHISFSDQPRGDVLTAHFSRFAPTTYTRGLA